MYQEYAEPALLELINERYFYKTRFEELSQTLKEIRSSFTCMGGPLNDNLLNFDNKQKKFIWDIKKLIDSVI